MLTDWIEGLAQSGLVANFLDWIGFEIHFEKVDWIWIFNPFLEKDLDLDCNPFFPDWSAAWVQLARLLLHLARLLGVPKAIIVVLQPDYGSTRQRAASWKTCALPSTTIGVKDCATR